MDANSTWCVLCYCKYFLGVRNEGTTFWPTWVTWLKYRIPVGLLLGYLVTCSSEGTIYLLGYLGHFFVRKKLPAELLKATYVACSVQHKIRVELFWVTYSAFVRSDCQKPVGLLGSLVRQKGLSIPFEVLESLIQSTFVRRNYYCTCWALCW